MIKATIYMKEVVHSSMIHMCIQPDVVLCISEIVNTFGMQGTNMIEKIEFETYIEDPPDKYDLMEWGMGDFE